MLLEVRADPNGPVNDGFPPLIAALSCTGAARGAMARSDVDDILRLLLSFGADPNQRGINDCTPLHMAVAEKNSLAIQILLDSGADPTLRRRIDGVKRPARWPKRPISRTSPRCSRGQGSRFERASDLV